MWLGLSLTNLHLPGLWLTSRRQAQAAAHRDFNADEAMAVQDKAGAPATKFDPDGPFFIVVGKHLTSIW